MCKQSRLYERASVCAAVDVEAVKKELRECAMDSSWDSQAKGRIAELQVQNLRCCVVDAVNESIHLPSCCAFVA